MIFNSAIRIPHSAIKIRRQKTKYIVEFIMSGDTSDTLGS